MPIRRPPVFLAGILLVTACSGFPFVSKAPAPAATESEKEPGQVRLELQDVHYDGATLSGRVLIGVVDGRLRLDKRLLAGIDAEIRYPADCHTGLGVSHLIFDAFPPRGRSEDLMILERGYWYGKELQFPLFDEHLSGPGPECLKAEIWLFSFDGKIAARTEVQAERLSGDGGTPDAPEVHFTGQSAGP